MAKRKLAILPFLCVGEIVKNSNIFIAVRLFAAFSVKAWEIWENIAKKQITLMGEGNVFTGVCLSMGISAFGGRGSDFGGRASVFGGRGSAWMWSAWRRSLPEGGLPERVRGLHADPPRDTVNWQSVRILLECILVSNAGVHFTNGIYESSPTEKARQQCQWFKRRLSDWSRNSPFMALKNLKNLFLGQIYSFKFQN